MAVPAAAGPLSAYPPAGLDPHDVNGRLRRARDLTGDVLPLDADLVPEGEDDRPDHGDQKHQSGHLEEEDVARIEELAEGSGVG